MGGRKKGGMWERCGGGDKKAAGEVGERGKRGG